MLNNPITHIHMLTYVQLKYVMVESCDSSARYVIGQFGKVSESWFGRLGRFELPKQRDT